MIIDLNNLPLTEEEKRAEAIARWRRELEREINYLIDNKLATIESKLASISTSTAFNANDITPILIGYLNNTSIGSHASAIGYDNTASGYNGSAIGYTNSASGADSNAIGLYNSASSSNCNAIGNYNTASNVYATAIGFYNTASGYYGTAVGIDNIAFNDTASAFGYDNAAEGIASTAIGRSNTAVQNYSSAVGFDNTASGYYSSALGDQCSASGYHSTAVGSGNSANADLASVFGRASTGSAYGAVALGNFCIAEASYATAVGYNTTASQNESLAIGFGCTASQAFNAAIGYKAYNDIYYSINFGGCPIVRDFAHGSVSNNDCIWAYSGAEAYILSQEVDLTMTEAVSIAIPTTSHFFPRECGIIVTSLTSLVTQPTVEFGDEVGVADLVSPILTTGLTASYAQQIFGTLLNNNGHTLLTANVTIGGTGTTMLGRFWFKGLLVMDE